jgi:3-oxoadipate enol-lactonase
MTGTGAGDHLISANGLVFRCRVDETAGDNAPWLVFSNSLMTDLTLWDDQAAVLSRRFRILRYDQRGHGDTTVPDADCRFDDLVDDVTALFDAFGIVRTVFVGISLGAVTALRLAARHPERVTRVAICDGNVATPPGGAKVWDERIHIAEAGGMEVLVEPTVNRWFCPASLEAGHPAIVRVSDMIRRTPFEGFVRCARALQSFDFRADLAGLQCPTLMLAGAEDGILPETLRQMADQVSGARFVQIDHAGHLPNIEQPEAFNRALSAFLDQA